MLFQNLISVASLTRKSTLKISVVGGSNSVMRRGYVKHLEGYLRKRTSQSTRFKSYSLGGVPNVFSLIQQDRYNIAIKSDLIFFEYCVNDRHAIELGLYSLELAGKSLEGFIRNCQASNPNYLIVILIFGVNQDNYYRNPCALSELYEKIGDRYHLPVINLTRLFREKQGVNFIKSLYSDRDDAHYTRPYGVQIVSETIAEQLEQTGAIASLISGKDRAIQGAIEPMYADNFAKLRFLHNFDRNKFFTRRPKVSVYQNTMYREKYFTLKQGNRLQFLLKGRLAAIFIKSDPNDGLIKIEFGSQQIVTSSYSVWVDKIRSRSSISAITLPLLRFDESQDFVPVSIAPLEEYTDKFELDYFKSPPPTKDPQKWKSSIIGIAYIGEIKTRRQSGGLGIEAIAGSVG